MNQDAEAQVKLEAKRGEILRNFPIRDDFSPQQQLALSLAANGNHTAMLGLTSKQTLKVLLRKGLIDAEGFVTPNGMDQMHKWAGKKELAILPPVFGGGK